MRQQESREEENREEQEQNSSATTPARRSISKAKMDGFPGVCREGEVGKMLKDMHTQEGLEEGGGVGGARSGEEEAKQVGARGGCDFEFEFEFDAFGARERLEGGVTRRVLQTSPLVVVFDGIGSPALHRAVCDVFLQAGMWTWGHTSLGGADVSHQNVFWKCSQSALEGCMAIEALSRVVLSLASAASGKQLVIQRLYANGHTFGQGGALHVDEDGKENYAALYYANLSWLPSWLGHTHYFPGTLRHLTDTPEELDTSLAVLPKPQRLVVHDGRQCHVGTPPHRSFSGLRITLAWKFGVTTDVD